MPGEPIRLAARLLWNGLRFQLWKRTGRSEKIRSISLEVTHDCVARCIMCNIWKIPPEVPNLPVEEWLRLLRSPILSGLVEIDVTGGEPFLKDDLPDLFRGMARFKAGQRKDLKSVAVTTNGLLTQRVLGGVEQILREFEPAGLDLVVVCAVDATGPLHDIIRNVPGAWGKVNATLAGLVEIRKTHPNLIIGLKTTVLPINVGELEPIAAYAREQGLFTIISPCIITTGRYGNPEKAGDFKFSREEKDQMIQFFQGEGCRWSFHAQRLAAYLDTGIMRKPCTCGFNYLFVRSSGEVFLCPLINKSLGNITRHPLDELLRSPAAARFRRRVGAYPECRGCTEPGLERVSLPYEGFTYLSLLFRLGSTEFMKLHRHLGLDKYLS
jgi:MoaA/NifB/PqqE/SkfB family radical SAM enzyme